MKKIEYSQFDDIEMAVGTIVEVKDFVEAHRPAYKLKIDFGGSLGLKNSSAQLKKGYTIDQLMGRQIIAVVNLPPKQIGPFISEVLVLGVDDALGVTQLLKPDKKVPDGKQIY